MQQYCRYCSNCVGQTDNWGICKTRNEAVNKYSIRNACRDFDFCEVDAFYYTRSDNPDDAIYKPRGTGTTKQCEGQISFLDQIKS